jgi:hypothetical protein
MRAGFTASLIAFSLLLAQPAFSASPAPKAVAPAAAAPVGVLSDAAVSKMANTTPEQRDAMVKAQAEKLKKMTPEERKAFFEANRKRFNALSPEQKKALNEKMKKASADYIASHKAEWDRHMAECKKMQDKRAQEFVEKMPAIERAVLLKYKELRKNHGKDYAWRMIIEDAAHGGKITPVPESK